MFIKHDEKNGKMSKMKSMKWLHSGVVSRVKQIRLEASLQEMSVPIVANLSNNSKKIGGVMKINCSWCSLLLEMAGPAMEIAKQWQRWHCDVASANST